LPAGEEAAEVRRSPGRFRDGDAITMNRDSVGECASPLALKAGSSENSALSEEIEDEYEDDLHLFVGYGRLCQSVRSVQSVVDPYFFKNALNKSIGKGRNVVVLCSLAISRMVWR